jgi:sugar O-acyltransferase (sialic acid O-acetyltransferase NeuD family)
MSTAGTQRLIILGTGGNAVDIVDLVHDLNAVSAVPQFECAGFLDDNHTLWGTTLHGVPVLGPLAKAAELVEYYFINGIGSPSNFWRKDAILGGCGLSPERFVTLVHPSAVISRTASLGRGVVVFPHVTVCSNARIGDQVCVLPSSVVSHDVRIGDYSCVAGGVSISGGVDVGQRCYLGSGSTLIGGIHVHDGALVGMGSVVVRDVPPNAVVAGNPARFLRAVVPTPVAIVC